MQEYSSLCESIKELYIITLAFRGTKYLSLLRTLMVLEMFSPVGAGNYCCHKYVYTSNNCKLF